MSPLLLLLLAGQSHFGLANPINNTEFGFSGYVKLDAIASNYSDGTLASGNIGRDFYIPSLTPVAGMDEDTQFDAHIRQSRFRFTTSTKLDNQDTIKGVLEFDMQVVPDGDERISNSHQPRIRHAFLTYKNWLFGQTWTTFQDVSALPETLDFIGVTDGTIFARQALVRYTQGPFQIALENPESTITPYGGGGRIVSDDNAVPDLVLRYNHQRDWGHFMVAALVRQLAYKNQQGGNDIDSTETSYGISLGAKFKFGQDDLRLMFNTGAGLGRYSALNAVNGAVLDANNELQAIDSTGYAISYRHLWNNQWRSNFTYSAFNADNDTDLTGLSATESTWSTRANLLFSPSKELTFGAEYAFAKREIESGLEGDMNRLQFSAKYAF
ncbi:DcaP family trimeric outer membrane transporter [Planctobacterium marinum]